MLNSFKSKAPEQDFKSKTPEHDKSPTADMPEFVQPHRPAAEAVAPKWEPPKSDRAKSGPDSCIGSNMSVVGKIECDGAAQVYGRIEGELRASELMIGTGAQIEGNVIAENVTICGRIKGTIRAVRVKLQNGGAVEGDIFHRSLSIDESSLFEGSARRVENPADPSSGVDLKRDIQSPPRRVENQGAASSSVDLHKDSPSPSASPIPAE